MSVNNVSLRGGGRQPVVRKNLFSMHEDLTSWSQLLQDPEMMSTESDSQSISIPSVHQSIKSVSNKYRPLSMSFQQWQNSIAFPEETLESLQAPMENDFDIHRDLKSLAFKLQFVANLELQQDEERGLHVHGDQVLKNEIEKLISTTPTRMSSNETLGDPYSAKLDNILECEDESVVSSIAGSETSDATVPEENENNDYLHTKTLDDEASNAIGPDQSLTENEKVNIHLVHKMESTSIDDDLVAQPTVLSSAQDLSLVSEQEGTYTVYEEQDKTADHHEVFSDINEVFTIENSKEKIELEAVMESTSEEEHDKLVEKKIVTSSAISTTTVTSTDSLEVVSTVPIVVQTNNQNNTSEYTSVTPRSSLSCSDSRESIANEGDDARQSYNDQHQIDLQMDDELNSKDDVQSSNVITIEQNYDFTASNTATAETCVQISANQNKIDLEESSTSYEGINDPQNNIELAEKCTEHINEGFSCDLSDERKHSTGSTNFVDAQQKIFASQKVTTEQEIMPNEMDLLLYRPDRNTMEEENSYSEAAEVCSLASSSESFTVEVHHDDNETRKVVFSNDSSKLNLIEQDIEIAAHDLDGDISTSDAVKSTDVNHQSSVETVTKFGYNTDLQISCTQDIYDPAAEIVKSDATNAFHDPEQEEESTRMPSDDIVFVSEKAIERSTSPDMIHETYYVENMSEDNNEEETPHKVIVLEELPILSQEDANQAKSLKQIEIEEYTSVTKVTENQQMVSPKQIYVTEIKSHQEESIANSYPKKETAHFEQQKDNLFQKRHEARINVDEITLPEVTDNATNGLKTLSMGKIKADDPFKIDNEEPLQTETKTTVEADYHYQAIVTVQHEPAIENLCVESYQKVPIEKSSNLNAKISDDKACIVQDCEIVGKQINAYSSGSEDTAKFEKTPAVVSPQPERTEVQIPKTDEVDNRSSIVYEEDGGNFSVIEHKKALLSENIDNPCVISSQEEVCVEISYSISSETVVSNAIIQTKNSDLKDKCATSTTQQLVEKYNQVEAEKENTTLSLPLALSTDNKASSDIQETVSENTFNGDFKESEINLLKTVGFSNAETLEEKEDEVGVPPVHIGMRATSIAGQNKSAFQQKKSMFEKSPDCTTKHVPVYHSSPLKKFRTFNSPTSNDVDISRETPVVSARSSAESTVHQFSEPYTTNKEAIHQHKSPTSFFSAKPFSFSSIKAGHVAPIKRAFSPVSGKLKLKDSPTQQSLPQKPLSSTSSNDCHKPAVPPKPLTTSKPILSKVQSGVSCDKPAAESLPAIVSPKPWNHNLDTKSNIKKPKVIHPPDLSPFEKVKPDISHNLPVSFSSSTISNVTPLLPPAPDEEVLADLFSNEGTMKPTMEDFVLPPPPPSDSDFTPHSNGTSSFNENQKSTTQESFRNPQNDDLPPPPPVLPVSPPPPTASGFFKSDKPKGFRKVARPVSKKPINSNQGKEQTSSTYSIQGTSFPASQSADAHVTAKENLPDGAVYQTTSSDGDVVHTETYYPASEQGDAKTVVLERTKTTTIVQAPHHQGIGPVNDSGVPCALRTSVDDSKHWYKNMFKQMHKVEPHNDASARSGRRLSSNSGDDSHRHTSTEISKPTKVGRITDYQPAQPYVVENKPDPIPTAVSYSNSSDKPATAKTSTKLHTNNAKASISETKKVMSSINKTTAKPQSTKDVEMRLPARAKFDFVPQTAKEYALKKGQTVIIAKKVDDNWYMVQSVDGSKSGIVPSTYVEVVSGSSPEKPLRNGHARAKFDLAGNSKNELSFKKGDEILLLKKVDANWYKAKLAGKTGIAPAVYLEVTMEPETSEKKDNTPNIVEHYVQSAKSESAQRNTSHSQQSSTLSQASSDEPDEKERKQRAAFLASTVVEAKVALHPSQKPSHREDFLDDLSRSSNAQERPLTAADDSSNNQVALNQAVDDLSNQPKNDIAPTTLIPSVPSYPSSNISTEPSSPHFPAPPATDYGQVIGCYVALYGYEASNDDELDLEPGDVVMVVETCDDGWYVGTCQRTGAFGTFPGNYVSLANST